MLLGRSRSPLEARLGYRFRQPELAELALTHRSWANEQGLPVHSERLEFLGDSVLGLITAEWLYRNRPELPEGDLSKLKAQLVSSRSLAGYAAMLGLAGEIRLGVGEERSGGRAKESVIADATEAVFGAVYLDGGLEAVRKVIVPLLTRALSDRPQALLEDAKTRLQEVVQARGWELPEYRLVGEEGPDHRKVFTVTCRLADGQEATAEGHSKKVAEQRAAAALLAELVEAAGTGAAAHPTGRQSRPEKG